MKTQIPTPDAHQEMREALRGAVPAVRFRLLAEGRHRPRLSRGLRRCADRGRLAGRADPAGVRRLRPGPGRGLGDHGGDQPLGRQRRLLPRPDVQHGHAAAARLGGAEAAATCPASPAASCACSRWRSPSPPPAPTPRKLKTTAVRKGDRYVVNGQKVWISRIQHSDLMILLARTTPLARGQAQERRHEHLPGRPARGHRQGHDGAADPEHGEPRDQRSVLRRPARSRRRT